MAGGDEQGGGLVGEVSIDYLFLSKRETHPHSMCLTFALDWRRAPITHVSHLLQIRDAPT
jgi:hypothetical protein